MECQYRSANGRFIFKLAGTMKGLFEQVALLEEVFGAEDKCGCCGSSNIRFRIRKVTVKATGKEARYYELRCFDCWSQFDFGVNEGESENLFPKRFKEGKEIGKGGWYKYNGGNGPQQQDDSWPA
jgi:hypothetical protein